jgi:hypothetical protein
LGALPPSCAEPPPPQALGAKTTSVTSSPILKRACLAILLFWGCICCSYWAGPIYYDCSLVARDRVAYPINAVFVTNAFCLISYAEQG